MSGERLIVAFLVLLAYGGFVHTVNGAAEHSRHTAAAMRTSLLENESWDPAAPPRQYVALRRDAERYHQLVYLVNMSLMFLGLYVGIGPFATRALDRGIVDLREGLRDAERRRESAQAELEAAQERLRKIDEDAQAIRDREHAAAEEEAQRLREQARRDAAQIAEHASLTASREAKHLQEAIVARVAALAVDRAMSGLEGELDETGRAALAARMVEVLRG